MSSELAVCSESKRRSTNLRSARSGLQRPATAVRPGNQAPVSAKLSTSELLSKRRQRVSPSCFCKPDKRFRNGFSANRYSPLSLLSRNSPAAAIRACSTNASAWRLSPWASAVRAARINQSGDSKGAACCKNDSAVSGSSAASAVSVNPIKAAFWVSTPCS